MKKITGVTVTLASLYTKDCPGAGDFLALKDFADFCEKAGLSLIQLLPVNDTGTHSSPYSGLSAYALHPVYIRINALPEFEEAFEHDKTFAAAYKKFQKQFKYESRFNYDKLLESKTTLLHLLYNYIDKKIQGKVKGVKGGSSFGEQFFLLTERFARKNKWLQTYAVFKNLKDDAMQASWKSWPEELAHMDEKHIKLRWNNKALKVSHNFFVWCQLRAHEQFKEAADYVKSKNILLKGDIPILMNEDSADCWAHPEYFNQELRAGSPPDGENPMGQNWGFPTYNWNKIAEDDFSWWKQRVSLASQYYSAFRIDHILGFFRIWAVSQKESTAYLGHTIPYANISQSELEEAGFTEDRLKWLSQPHIPTKAIEDITGNHEEALSVFEKTCDRVKTEELWNFKKEITGDNSIFEMRFFEDNDKDWYCKQKLAEYWRNRCLIEEDTCDQDTGVTDEAEASEEINSDIKKEKFYIPVYSYGNSTAWQSLSGEEKTKLEKIFATLKEEENTLWKKQALSVLTPITSETEMIACAEDLGVNLKCMNEVLKELNILSLKVIRWNREWQKDGQPYIPFNDYPELSVATTSVHDSSTLRQWWNDEKQSVESFIKMAGAKEDINAADKFTAKEAEYVLSKCAECKSDLFVNPLQDYLFLDDELYLEDENAERINVPGSVNEFNWTYRLPVSIEKLSENKKLLESIKNICNIHSK
ncbi:4-alpha-glucanotransferase [Treponema sp.]|uniref:4-alpha-glucanotransferase n=1 Tax=Treponema sp. TaxID=166 RepID=UPI0025FD1322|nr:4-alpha-glucanotransferase [Treponema sp.]MCR5218335.1 4-alpha-glucanotransferase [Treponema sp.]